MQPFRLGFTPFVDKHVLATVNQAYHELFPKGSISPENGDTDDLLTRLKEGTLDAALVTLPLSSDGYRVQPVMHEQLVVCLRNDDPLASHEEIPPELLNGKLAIFSDPRHHPLAHAKLLEMLAEQSIQPRVSNPTFNAEHVQWMVREGLCVALIRHGEPVHEDLTTRPIRGVSWTIDSAIVYRPEHDQMALPLLLRDLNRRFCVAGIRPPICSRTWQRITARSSGPTSTARRFPWTAGRQVRHVGWQTRRRIRTHARGRSVCAMAAPRVPRP
jgi:DNA-binding transcriptional LysR family regulator